MAGYNTTAGYIEEDSVQALEQIVSEKFWIGRDACKYWQEQRLRSLISLMKCTRSLHILF